MSAKEIEFVADKIAAKDLATSCNTLDKLFDESYRNTHKDSAGKTDAAKDWGDYYKKELMPLTKKLVDSKLLPSLSTGDAQDKQLRVQGTFTTPTEKFLVIADGQSGSAHEVYLQDKEGKFIRGQINSNQSGPEGKFTYDMNQRFDSIDAARAGQLAKPGDPPPSFMPPASDTTQPPAGPPMTDAPSAPAGSPKAADAPAPPKAGDTPAPPKAADTPAPPKGADIPALPKANDAPAPPNAAETMAPPSGPPTASDIPAPPVGPPVNSMEAPKK